MGLFPRLHAIATQLALSGQITVKYNPKGSHQAQGGIYFINFREAFSSDSQIGVKSSFDSCWLLQCNL